MSGESSNGESSSKNVLSNLRQFRYEAKPVSKISNNTSSQTSDGPLKLNTKIFKRLLDPPQTKDSDKPPPIKKEKVTDPFASFKFRTYKSFEESLAYVQKLFPRLDAMEVQDALIKSKGNVHNAVLLLNEVIKEKINQGSPPKPTVASTPPSSSVSTSTTSDCSTSTVRTWRRIVTSPVKKTVIAKPIMAPKPKIVKEEVYSEEESSEEEYYNPKSKRQSVVDFLSNAPLTELLTIPGLTAKKAEIILQIRPLKDWVTCCKKLEDNNLRPDSLYENISETLRIRNEVSGLMKSCTDLSQNLGRKIGAMANNSNLTEQPLTLSPGLKLASYQMIGLNWLKLLHEQNVNGILADEMGLGKTVQVIAFFAYLKENNLKNGVHVTVVPSSTLENWLNEFKRWCPDLNVEAYYGSQEERRNFRFWWRDEKNKEDVKKVDIVLTTYNLVSSTSDDKFFFRKLLPQYIVYDEAHMLKNMTTQRYASLMRIDAEHRILLTGTPLQNNLIELMSLLIFVMPQMFADKQNDLKKMFKTKSASEDNDEKGSFEKDKINQAKKIMDPFILRRLKSDVLADLPPKSDRNEYCDMTKSQADRYAELVAEFQAEDDEGDSNDGEPEEDVADQEIKTLSGSMAFMMLLRRAANHATLIRHHYSERILKTMTKKLKIDSLYREDNHDNILESLREMSDFQIHQLCIKYKSIGSYKLAEKDILNSGKLEKLNELLPELQSNNHRVLLFSQFRQALDIVETYLQIKNYKYVRFDGQTPVVERQSLIDDFNNDPSIFVFLLTTKAGGFGINLASADTVIIHDIDLNPYNDKQAEDRCHRVGQTRPVNIIRLIARNTIEEAMLKIAHNKLDLEKQITQGGNTKHSEKRLYGLLKDSLKSKQ